jgi:uncharacterized protein
VRSFREFRHREAVFLAATGEFDALRRAVRSIREELGVYIRHFPDFASTLTPLDSLPGTPPEAARRMHAASLLCGVGPMAAVAGATAQLAAEAARRAGCRDTVVNNGGDIFLHLAPGSTEVLVGLYGGGHALSAKLAFSIGPSLTPLSVCSSSSRMGHSRSFGACDLATVCAADAALADAAATLAGNLSTGTATAAEAAERVAAIEGVEGVLILIEDKFISAGSLPPLVSAEGPEAGGKVLRHPLNRPYPD